MNYVFSKFSTNSNVNGYEVDNLPFPKHTELSHINSISSLVTSVLSAKAEDPTANTAELEYEIDSIVYRLYGLTSDEIRIVEKGL